MRTLLVTVEAEAAPAKSGPRAQPSRYYQTLGVTGADEPAVLAMIQDFLKHDVGSSLVDVAEVWVPDLEGEDSDIKAGLCGNPAKPGIWYKGGRMQPERAPAKDGE